MSQPLLRSALIALGAGGGLMVGGCALLGAAPASAQTLLSANPHAIGGAPAAHHSPHVNPRSRVNVAGHGAHGRAANPPKHTTSKGAPKAAAPVAHAAAVPATTVTGTTATANVSTANVSTGYAIPAPILAAANGTSPGKSHGARVHASGAASAAAPVKVKGNDKKASRATAAKATKNAKATRTAKGHPAAPRPAAPTPLALLAILTPPERLSLVPYNPFVLVPVLSGPGPARLPAPASPLPTISLNPFHVPLSIPRGWEGQTLRESAKLKVPLALLAAMALFVLVQSLVDRRDPKLSRAPERQGQDSIGFG